MVDLREMVNACLYLEKAGWPWRYVPSDFAPWATVRTGHDRFRADATWSEVAALLTRAMPMQTWRRRKLHATAAGGGTGDLLWPGLRQTSEPGDASPASP